MWSQQGKNTNKHRHLKHIRGERYIVCLEFKGNKILAGVTSCYFKAHLHNHDRWNICLIFRPWKSIPSIQTVHYAPRKLARVSALCMFVPRKSFLVGVLIDAQVSWLQLAKKCICLKAMKGTLKLQMEGQPPPSISVGLGMPQVYDGF